LYKINHYQSGKWKMTGINWNLKYWTVKIYRLLLLCYITNLLLNLLKSPFVVSHSHIWLNDNDESHRRGSHILIVSAYTDSIAAYAEISRRMNEEYAARFNYGYLNYVVTSSKLDPSADKLEFVLSAMAKYPEYDYVMWMDADAVFMDLEVPLQQLVDGCESSVFITGGFKHGPPGLPGLISYVATTPYHNVNGGVFLVENTFQGFKFMTQWQEFTVQYWQYWKFLEREQEALQWKYNLNIDNIKDDHKMCWVEPIRINSEFRTDDDGNRPFIYHLMGQTIDNKYRIMAEIEEEKRSEQRKKLLRWSE